MKNKKKRQFETAADGVVLPVGKYVDLEEHGRMFYRECPGKPGAPTLLLIHGMLATSGLNWLTAFDHLRAKFRVIAPDLRGHGRSMREDNKRFTLKNCADDLAALIDHLDLGPVIVVGYSMGGAVAQRLWKRHPEKIAGLVLSATGYKRRVGFREMMITVPLFEILVSATRAGELFARLPKIVLNRLFPGVNVDGFTSRRHWVVDEVRHYRPRVLFESAREMAHHDARKLLPTITVPTAVLITIKDRSFSVEHQLAMALQIPDASIFRFKGGHTAVTTEEYARALTRTCRHVAQRIMEEVMEEAV